MPKIADDTFAPRGMKGSARNAFAEFCVRQVKKGEYELWDTVLALYLKGKDAKKGNLKVEGEWKDGTFPPFTFRALGVRIRKLRVPVNGRVAAIEHF